MPTYRVGVRLKAFDAGFGGVLRRAAGAAGRVGSAAQRAAGRGSSAFRRVAGDAAALGDQSVHVTINGSVYAEDRERLLDDLVDRVRDAQWERLL